MNELNLTLDDILKAVSETMEVSEADIKSMCRKREFSLARQMAWNLSRKYTRATLTQIGNFYNRDHATIIFGVGQIEDLMSCYKKIRQSYKRAHGILIFDAMEKEGEND